MTSILAFTKVRGPGGWMGNMAPYPVTYLGVTARTTEHLFQALRLDPGLKSEEAQAVLGEPSPMGAKLRFKELVRDGARLVVEPRSDEDVDNMRLAVQLKLAQHPELHRRLAETGSDILVEDTSGRRIPDTFWGARRLREGETRVEEPFLVIGTETWVGLNRLGRIWMAERDRGRLI